MHTYSRNLLSLAIFSLSLSSTGIAQSADSTPHKPQTSETMVVLGEAAPVPLAESSRSITVLPVEEKKLSAESVQDLLRSDASVSLEQRGAGGGQADVLLRGGGFEQTLVLLNGFRVNDSQTGHHNLDLPLPLEAMDSIEVLSGAGSTLHGADALSGVVDFLTAAPTHNALWLRAGAGSFDENEQALMADGVRRHSSARLTAERNFSEGFTTDRDYRNEDAALESWIGSRLGLSDLLLASSDRAFGANQFYGDYNSWERTKGWLATARQELGARTTAAFGYRRHTDDFVLLRTFPAAYANNHADSSWQTSLRQTAPLAGRSLALFGLEADGDRIDSVNSSDGVLSAALGNHARNRGAGYVDVDLRPTGSRWTLSAGAREELFSGGLKNFSPELAGSLRVAPTVKLRASGGYGFRIPTYTDLYYSDPTTKGNPNLKPESAWSGEGGVDWLASAHLTLAATGFYAQQHDTIDYLRANASAVWQAANLSGVRFTGAEASATWKPMPTQTVRLSWTALNGAQNALHGQQSEYVFNYPVENVHASWQVLLPKSILLENSLQVTEHYQQTPYPVWGMTLGRNVQRLRPYLRLSNLSNTGYQEVSDVAMPGRSIAGGFVYTLGR
ncbi:TonB-dependent receptor plug domain-containing protein [Telmatobacter bradus]|uniref:TonB-dependent receptor plug domain-containing protein n=1 Tax=Telmatobacter bradus TaxID=474953 RepID=UPI003B43AB0A